MYGSLVLRVLVRVLYNLQEAYNFAKNNLTRFYQGKGVIKGNVISIPSYGWMGQDGYWGVFLYDDKPIAAYEWSIATKERPPC